MQRIYGIKSESLYSLYEHRDAFVHSHQPIHSFHACTRRGRKRNRRHDELFALEAHLHDLHPRAARGAANHEHLGAFAQPDFEWLGLRFLRPVAELGLEALDDEVGEGGH